MASLQGELASGKDENLALMKERASAAAEASCRSAA